MDLIEKIKAIPYWYHKIELPGDIITPGWSPICAEKYAIPDDLTGKRVLDIGAWDGYWTFEALKRGAKEVIAIDDFSDDLGEPQKTKRNKWETFDLCREALGFLTKIDNGWLNEHDQICQRQEVSVYDITEGLLGRFDVVFFFGTLYHLKHPMLALEKISAICDGEIYIESAISDDYSPYKGGLDKGYRNNDMVAEFYPNNEYGNNPSNWWVPTLQCLGYMVQTAGFANIEMWRLTENPRTASECRGFVYGTKLDEINLNIKKQSQTEAILSKRPKVMAVMSTPRLGFMSNFFCIYESLVPLKIPVTRFEGVFWGQCLERALQDQIDIGADMLLTIDYDGVFIKGDIQELISLMEKHPEADAIVPMELGREGKGALCTIRTITGQWLQNVPREMFMPELSEIATGHFGLTLIRASALLKMPHPWFLPVPNKDGQWGRDHTDDDIYFWRKFKSCGCKAYLANRIVIAQMELVLTWPDENLQPIYQTMRNYQKNGKPENVWK